MHAEFIKDMTDFLVEMDTHEYSMEQYQELRKKFSLLFIEDPMSFQKEYLQRLLVVATQDRPKGEATFEGVDMAHAGERLERLLEELRRIVRENVKEKNEAQRKEGFFKKLFQKVKKGVLSVFQFLTQDFDIKKSDIQEDALKHFRHSENPYERCQVARHEKTPLEVVAQMTFDPDERVVATAMQVLSERLMEACMMNRQEEEPERYEAKGKQGQMLEPESVKEEERVSEPERGQAAEVMEGKVLEGVYEGEEPYFPDLEEGFYQEAEVSYTDLDLKILEALEEQKAQMFEAEERAWDMKRELVNEGR